MSFRLKTIFGVAIIEIILLVLLVWSSLNILRNSHEEELQRQADMIITLLENATRDSFIAHDLETLNKISNDLLENPAIASIRMTDDKGVSLYDHQTSTDEMSLIQRSHDVIIEGYNFGQVRIALSRQFVDDISQNAQQQMIGIAVVEVLLVAFFSYVLGTYLTQNLEKLRHASHEIAEGKLGVQVVIASQDEVGETAQSFNRMSLKVKELYEEIHANEKRTRTIVNTVNDGILTIDSQGIILSANPAITKLFHYERNELLGRPVHKLLGSAKDEALSLDLRLFFQQKETPMALRGHRIVAYSKLGHALPLEVSVNPMFLDGEVLYVGTLRDLRLEEKAQQDLLKAQKQLIDAVESSNDGFVFYDENDELVICNQRYREIYASSADLLVPGTRFEKIIRDGVTKGLYAEAIGREEEWIAQRLEAHENPQGPVEQKLQDGRWIRVWENKTQTGATVGFRIDITELKAREEALLESQERFRATIDSALDCIICIDSAGTILEFNPAAEKCFGFKRADIMGQDMADLIIPPEMRDAHRKGMAHFHETGEGPVLGKRIEIEALRKNGERFSVELAIEVASGRDDQVIFVAYLRDITEQKAYENTLKEAKQRAEVANEAKAEFLAMMSHEIRTPLNGVLGVLGLMQETILSKEQKKYVHTAKESGEALLTIINDVLDFSKMEASKLQLEESAVALKPLASSLTELLGPQARAKGLDFKVNFTNDVPPSVLCDGGRLRQVLLNLISNAVKFTEKGKLEVRVSAQATDINHYRVRFEVEDTGIGIPDDKKDHVFSQFSTINGAYTRKVGGTGLGLAITKKLVLLMGGEIGFQSQFEQGSVFWFELPFQAVQDARQDSEETATLMPRLDAAQHLRILIAEDHPTNMMITRKILEKQGHVVIAAGDGIEAIQAVQDYPVDLILMDGSMPEMDGMEATRRIRQMPAPLQTVPIIALTAHTMKGDREKFLSAGMDDYLQKPIEKADLLRMIAKWSPHKIAPEVEEGEGEASPVPNSAEADLFDSQALDQLAADTEPEMISMLVQIYLDDARDRLVRVREAIETENFEVLELESHTLGSSAATYGLKQLHRLARQAEAACVQKQQAQALALSHQMVESAERSWVLLEAAKDYGQEEH